MNKTTVETLIKAAAYMAANFDSVDCRRLYVELCCAISAETGDAIDNVTEQWLHEPIPAIYQEDPTDMTEWNWCETLLIPALKTAGRTEVKVLITDEAITFSDNNLDPAWASYGLEGVADEYHGSICQVLVCCLEYHGIKLATVTKTTTRPNRSTPLLFN